MRTTVDIPDGMYRQLKSRAAREGSSTRALIPRGVKNVLKSERRKGALTRLERQPPAPSTRTGCARAQVPGWEKSASRVEKLPFESAANGC
jgi:hypothetical protein